jgi:hypothetical protein
MKLMEFLKIVKKESQREEIIILKGKKAIEAVKRNGGSLRYVKEQTPEICIEAVKRNGDSLRYVKEQTPEICIEAVKQDGYSLQYIDIRIFENE